MQFKHLLYSRLEKSITCKGLFNIRKQRQAAIKGNICKNIYGAHGLRMMTLAVGGCVLAAEFIFLYVMHKRGEKALAF